MKKWWQHYAGSVAFAMVLVVAVVGYSLVSDRAGDAKDAADDAHTAARHAHHLTDESNDAIVRAFRANCQGDRKFRLQYKARGDAEKQLLVLFLELARKQVESGVETQPGQLQTSREFIKKFGPLTSQIHVIPVPQCSDQIQTLRQAIHKARSG